MIIHRIVTCFYYGLETNIQLANVAMIATWRLAPQRVALCFHELLWCASSYKSVRATSDCVAMRLRTAALMQHGSGHAYLRS